jgi:hypothetical protein
LPFPNVIPPVNIYSSKSRFQICEVNQVGVMQADLKPLPQERLYVIAGIMHIDSSKLKMLCDRPGKRLDDLLITGRLVEQFP